MNIWVIICKPKSCGKMDRMLIKEIALREFFPGWSKPPFSSCKGRMGRLGTVGLRLSYVDLNDDKIKGGKENNFTAGMEAVKAAREKIQKLNTSP